MQTLNIWNKLHIHSTKVIVVLLLLVYGFTHAQNFLWARKNNPFYDEKRKITYGFLIGLHTTAYQIKYSNEFVDDPDLHSIVPEWKPGFSLGFLVNYRAHEFVDLRITPKVAFYEHALTYRYIGDPSKQQLIETTMVELPMLVKYKSMRRGNIRMYVIGGIKPGIEASDKRENISDALEVNAFNLNMETGIGFDLYFPLFKFSPEIRFSRGLLNQLGDSQNDFSKSLSRINTNTITFYMVFQ
jgi:hypothetical protein